MALKSTVFLAVLFCAFYIANADFQLENTFENVNVLIANTHYWWPVWKKAYEGAWDNVIAWRWDEQRVTGPYNDTIADVHARHSETSMIDHMMTQLDPAVDVILVHRSPQSVKEGDADIVKAKFQEMMEMGFKMAFHTFKSHLTDADIEEGYTDDDGNSKNYNVATFRPNNEEGANQLAAQFCKENHPPGGRLIATYIQSASDECVDRIDGFKRGIVEHCPGEHQVGVNSNGTVITGDLDFGLPTWDGSQIYNFAAQFWTVHPEVNAIMSCWDNAAIQFVEAARNFRNGGVSDLLILGVDNDTVVLPYLSNGEIFATYDQQFSQPDRGMVASIDSFFKINMEDPHIDDDNYDGCANCAVQFDEISYVPVALNTRDMARYTYNRMMSTYDKSIPHLVNNRLDIDVDLDMKVLEVKLIDQQIFGIFSATITWKDGRLSWPEWMFDDILFPDINDIFIPNVQFQERSRQDFKLLDTVSLQLFNDGTLIMNIKEFNGFYCPFDIYEFPFDDHVCTIKAVSMTTSAYVHARDFTTNEVARDYVIQTGLAAGDEFNVEIIHDPLPMMIAVSIPSWVFTLLAFSMLYISNIGIGNYTDRFTIIIMIVLSTLQLNYLFTKYTEGKNCWQLLFVSTSLLIQASTFFICFFINDYEYGITVFRLLIVPSYLYSTLSSFSNNAGGPSHSLRSGTIGFLNALSVVFLIIYVAAEVALYFKVGYNSIIQKIAKMLGDIDGFNETRVVVNAPEILDTTIAQVQQSTASGQY